MIQELEALLKQMFEGEDSRIVYRITPGMVSIDDMGVGFDVIGIEFLLDRRETGGRIYRQGFGLKSIDKNEVVKQASEFLKDIEE